MIIIRLISLDPSVIIFAPGPILLIFSFSSSMFSPYRDVRHAHVDVDILIKACVISFKTDSDIGRCVT